MDRRGNLFIIEDDYTSIKTEASSSSNIKAIDHKNVNVNEERDEPDIECYTAVIKNERDRESYPAEIKYERDRESYPAANKNGRDRERYPAAFINERDKESYPAAITNEQHKERYSAEIQTSKRYEQLYDVGIKNIINNKTKSTAKSNREKVEYETNRRTPDKTENAANEIDQKYAFDEPNRGRSGNLFIVEINSDVHNKTNSTTVTASEKQNSTIETNRAASERENRKEEKTRETCNIFASNANTNNHESCKSADVNGETNKPTDNSANSSNASQNETKQVKKDLETFNKKFINANKNKHESCKVEDVNGVNGERYDGIDIITNTNFSTDNISHIINSSIDNSANSKKEDVTKDANASKKEGITKDANASKKEDITKDANASKKEDITKDANASKKEDVTKDASASHTEASVEDGRGVLHSDAGQMQEKDVRIENLQLLTEIAELCQRPDRQHVENIFLLGKPGAGKSALVNTIIKALTGSYIPKASVGAGVRQSKTLTLDSYKSCGVTKEDIKDPQHRKLVEDILPNLPTILDAAGRNDPKSYANPEGVEEILELFIGGFIPPGTSIEFLETKQKEHDVGCLRDVLFTESKPEWKATKIVFVQSCRDSLPVDLIQCLDRILRKTDPKTAQLKYTGEVFVVITKYDLVVDQKQINVLDPSTENISMQDFLTLENTVAEQFSIKGELDLNMIRWVSYGGKRSFDDPNIDNIALKFIKRMLAPGNKPAESTNVPVVMTPEKLKKLEAQKSPKESTKDLGFYASHIKLVAIVILFALFLEFVKTLLSAKLE